jgi:hypothetical protein
MQVTIPNRRSFHIYHAIDTERQSPEATARRFGESVERVREVHAAVRQFVVEHGNGKLASFGPAKVELGMLHLCFERLDFFLGMVMRLLDQAHDQGNVAGAVRLMYAAARLSVEQAKLAGRVQKAHAALVEAGVIEPPREPLEIDFQLDDPPRPSTSPPVGGCTVSPAAPGQKLAGRIEPKLASPSEESISDGLVDEILRLQAAQERNKGPVQRDRKLSGARR